MQTNTAAGPLARAIWTIENRLGEPASLERLEQASGISRFQLARAFAGAAGMPVMQYVRARRLTEAARTLAAGADDILDVALDAGYASHEAFTRAFREQFGATPESVRAQKSVAGLTLTEAIRIDDHPLPPLDEPRIERLQHLLIAGFAERDPRRIPLLWQHFAPHINALPALTGTAAYGVCADADDDGSFTYVAGAEVARFDAIPPEFTCMRIPARTYAVFAHRGHVSTIYATCDAIWRTWQPQPGHAVDDAPFFERYDERFDRRTGNGEVEIFVPLAASAGPKPAR